MNYDVAPFIAIWETTQACALACAHCRAEAMDRRHPDELTTGEGIELIREVADMGTKIFVFSGGDPLQRPDLEVLVRAASARMRVGTIPAATDRITPERVASLKAAGLHQIAFSVDHADPERHDGFRGVPGSYACAMRGVEIAREAGLPFQINTVFGAWNAGDFDAICALVERLGVAFWEIFFLVPTGRGAALACVPPERHDELFAKIHALQKRAGFIVKITEAPHYRAYVAEREGGAARRMLARETGPGGSMGQAPRGVNSGKGFVFIGHTGDVYPSGFLPIRAGNVRETRPAGIYRDAPLFRELRDASRLGGRCGACRYRELCGGSRSRAYALTGDPMAEDPHCPYVFAPLA